MKIIGLLFILFCINANVYSQQYLDKTYGKNLNEVGQRIIQENDTTLVLMGWQQNNSFYIVKCNLAGDTIMSKTFSLPFNPFGVDIIQLPQNEYILIGNSGGLIKIDSSSNILWTKNISDCNLSSGKLLSDSSFVVTGSIPVFSHIDPSPIIDSVFYNDILLRKYDITGNLIKDTTYSFVNDDSERANDIIITKNNGILLTGYSYYNGLPNLFMIKTDSLWNVLVDTLYEYSGIYVGNAISENFNKDIFITGEKYINSVEHKNVIILKLDTLGNILWENNYDFSSIERGMSLIESSNNYHYIFGETVNGLNGPSQVRNLLLIKVNNNGATVFTKLFNNTGRKRANSILEVNDSTLALFGSTDYNTAGGTDMYLILSDSLGNFDITVNLHQNNHNPRDLLIYPNPASEFIWVKTKNIELVEIYDLQGKLIKKIIGRNDKLRFDVVAKGTYLIHIQTDKELFTRKIIIK